MHTKSLDHPRAPYIRGPHIRYLVIALLLAFLIALVVLTTLGFLLKLMSGI